jgi:hypothetical protein
LCFMRQHTQHGNQAMHQRHLNCLLPQVPRQTGDENSANCQTVAPPLPRTPRCPQPLQVIRNRC